MAPAPRSTFQTVMHLPPELKNLIASFSSLDSLASLALTSQEFRAHAEPFLYAKIAVSSLERSAGPLPTLVTTPGKALLVRFFTFQIGKRRRRIDASLMDLILQSAPTMKNLKDMRILLRKELHTTDFVKHLEDILCAQHFNLVQLYKSDCMDFARITVSQKDLRFLVMYSAVSGYRSPISLLSSHLNRSICVLGLAWLTYLSIYDSVTIFPDLMNSTQALTCDTEIRRTFEMDAMSGSVGVDHVTEVIVFLRKVPKAWPINALMKSLSKLFRTVNEVSFALGSCEGLVHVLETIEPVDWPCLREVGIWCWDPRDDEGLERRNVNMAVSEDEFAAYVRRWHQACPRLDRVQICNGWLASYDESCWTYKCS